MLALSALWGVYAYLCWSLRAKGKKVPSPVPPIFVPGVIMVPLLAERSALFAVPRWSFGYLVEGLVLGSVFAAVCFSVAYIVPMKFVSGREADSDGE